MTNSISVSITADVADLVAKRAIMSAELKAATADLNAFAKTARTSGMTDELRAGMLQAGEAVAKARAQIRGLDSELRNLTGSGKGFLDNVFDRSRLAVVQEGAAKVPIFGSAIAALGPEAIAAGAAIGALWAVVKEGIKAADWAEELKRASSTLGLTTTQLQEFDFVNKSLGIDVEAGRKALSGLEVTIGRIMEGAARKQLLQQFTDVLKISPADLRGWGTLEEQLPHIIDAFAKLDPEERAATAQKLGVDPEVIATYVTEREEIGKLIDEFHAYGLDISSNVIDQSAKAAVQLHATSAIVDGEMRQAFINAAPLIAGGAKALADFARDAADAVRGAGDVARGVGDVWKQLQDFNAKADQAVPLLRDMDDWFHKSVGGIDDSNSALGHFKTTVETVLNPLGALVDLLRQLGAADRKSGGAVGAQVGDQLGALAPSGQRPRQQIPTAGGRRRRGGRDTARQIADIDAQTALQIQKAELEDEKGAVEAAYREETVSAQQKHDQLAALARQEAADEIAAQEAKRAAAGKNVAAAHEAANQELVIQANLKARLDELDRQLTEDKRREQQKRANDAREATREILEGLQKELEEHKKAAEEQARAWKTANDEVLSAEGQLVSGVLSGRETLGQLAGKIALDTAQKEITADLQYFTQHALMRAEGLATDKATAEGGFLVHLLGENKKLAASAVGQAGQTAAHGAGTAARAGLETAGVATHAGAEAAKTGATFTGVAARLAAETGGFFAQVITKLAGLVGIHIGGEAAKTGATVVGATARATAETTASAAGLAAQKIAAAAEIPTLIGLAGAGGVASMAAAPFPLDLGAPAFGAAMAAAAGGYGSLAALDVGTNLVPADMIAQIHAGERIIPAADNAALMRAVGAGPVSNRGGDFHGDFSTTIHGGSGVDVVRELERSQGRFARLLKGMHRGGHFDFARAA